MNKYHVDGSSGVQSCALQPLEPSMPAQSTEGTVPCDTMGRIDSAADERDHLSLSLPPTESTMLPTIHDVWACQFSVWYSIFSSLPTKYKRRSNVTIKSHVIKPLPSEFIQYLLNQDQRFILPHDVRTSSALLEANRHRADDNDAWSSSCDDPDSDNEPNAVMSSEGLPSPPTFSFPELNEQIRQAIQSFPNQACVPKLNWSSPKDAVWINGNTMECRTAGDVYLLCKASDFITFDLLYARTDVVSDGGDDADDATGRGSHSTTSNAKQPPSPNTVTTTTPNEDDNTTRNNHTVQENVDNGDESNLNFSFELALRKFCNLYPSQEFRCFVSYDTLIGISQRHQHYNFPFLQQSRDEYSLLIYDFYERAIRPNVHRMSSRLQQYVVDLYIDQQQRVWIIDFNVWGTRTDAILFHWSELVALSNQAKLLQKQQARNHPDDVVTEISIEPIDTILRRVDFRIVESSSQPSNSNDTIDNHHHHQQQQQPIHPSPLSNYKAPMDALLLSHHGDATTASTFQDFMKLCVRPSANYNNDDSNDSSSSSVSDAEE